MRARLSLRGLRAEGRHGATPGERDAPQPFLVDLEIEVSPRRDALELTADYREVVLAARRVIEEESHVLLETMAEAVARAVWEVPGVEVVRATVHKPNAAEKLGLDDVAAHAVVE
jgi:dihydroneopterin aldolase